MTFTLLAIDRSAGLLGVGTASLSLAVGNSVPAIDPAVGIVASQAWTNRLLRGRVLDAIRAGESPAEAIARIPEWDDGHALRQVAVIDVDGRIASHTGDRCSEWAGERRGADHIAIGNVLVGPDVVDALSTGFADSRGASVEGHAVDLESPGVAFARRILAGLRAAEEAGGDRRGRQSAALVVGEIDRNATYPPELLVDLRVDDAPDPLAALARLIDLRAADGIAPDTQPSKGLTAPRTTVSPS